MMSTARISGCVVVAIAVVAGCDAVDHAAAQPLAQPGSGSASDQPAGASDSSDTDLKKRIITSPEWKQAYDEFQRWLGLQVIYTPTEVERIKANLATQIQVLSASELQGFLDDWQARLRVLNGRDFQEAQQWLGEFLMVVADGFRRQTLADWGLVDVSNMTARQLEDAITRIRAERLSSQQRRATFDQHRQQMVQRVQQNNGSTQQNLQQRNSVAAQFDTHRSPYRPATSNPPAPAPRRQFFVDGNGRIGFTLPF
jgi:hypothetical protein